MKDLEPCDFCNDRRLLHLTVFSDGTCAMLCWTCRQAALCGTDRGRFWLRTPSAAPPAVPDDRPT